MSELVNVENTYKISKKEEVKLNKVVYTILSLITVMLLISGCGTTAKTTESTSPPPQLSKEPSNASWDEIPANQEPSNPSQTVLAYFDSLEKGDFPTAKKYLSKASQTKISDESLKALALEYKHNRKNVRIWNENKRDDVSRIKYLYNKISDDTIVEEVIYLVLEEGVWKITHDTPKLDSTDEKN